MAPVESRGKSPNVSTVFVMELKRMRWLCAMAVALFGGLSADGQTVRNIQSRLAQPIAPRGGVMLLPLTADKHGNQWPEQLPLRAADGRTLTGYVAWMHPAPPRLDRHWTDDPRNLMVRAPQPEDNSANVVESSVLGPYLLVQVPHDMEGNLRLGKQKLQPTWLDIPRFAAQGVPALESTSPFATLPDAPALTISPSPDRPDPVSPFEYWRWVLLADRLEMNPAPALGNQIERMTAEHFAALWRIGLERLAKLSPRVAEQCRNLLTQTTIDHRQPFATWVSDPAQVAALLSILLDDKRSDSQILSDAVAWIDHQLPLVFWPQAQFGNQVTLSMATIRTEPVVTTFRWVNTNEPAQSVRIEPGVLMQVTIDRPPLPLPRAIGLPAPDEPTQQALSIEAGGMRFEITFGPRVLQARPPGVFFAALSPPLTLTDVQLRQPIFVPPDHATFAQVRRLSGRWEAFIECRRPRGETDEAAPPLPETIRSFDELRGIEAVTILIKNEPSVAESGGEQQQQQIWLVIPETGYWKLVSGENDGTLQIHRSSYGSRWYCRVVLPDAWFSAAETNPAYIGFIRSHGDSNELQTGPSSSAPWRPEPGQAAINLDLWDEVAVEH